LLYIIVALKAEAQAFIDRYKLSKSTINEYKIFQNSSIILIISGIGIENSMRATQALINQYDITDDDIYLNIGICGASKQYEIGELLLIDEIEYNDKHYKLKSETQHIIKCIDFEAESAVADIVDMESYGFYEAVYHSPAIKNLYVLKIVSDHFEPKKVTKDKAKSLIFNKIDDINAIINFKEIT